MATDKPQLSDELLTFKSMTPEEIAQETAAEIAQEEARKIKALADEVEDLRVRVQALKGIPADLIFAAALDRHTAAMHRIADGIAVFNAQFERAVDAYSQQAEWERVSK
jgi:hypothetical protein